MNNSILTGKHCKKCVCVSERCLDDDAKEGCAPPGECVLALKSMIGSTAQQFHTYLSHRGEETGNIRGSMRVRVPSERMGTRERLYGTTQLSLCVRLCLWVHICACLSEYVCTVCVHMCLYAQSYLSYAVNAMYRGLRLMHNPSMESALLRLLPLADVLFCAVIGPQSGSAWTKTIPEAPRVERRCRCDRVMNMSSGYL